MDIAKSRERSITGHRQLSGLPHKLVVEIEEVEILMILKMKRKILPVTFLNKSIVRL